MGDSFIFISDINLIVYLSMSSPTESEKILLEVKNKIKSYPFNFRGASILTGQEEGAYGWVTVNYLLENFAKVPQPVFKRGGWTVGRHTCHPRGVQRADFRLLLLCLSSGIFVVLLCA